MEQATDHLEQAVLDEARKVNEERMKAVQNLASIVAEKHELEEQLKDNSRRERSAMKAAEKAGWTQAQIKRFMKPPKKQINVKNTPEGKREEKAALSEDNSSMDANSSTTSGTTATESSPGTTNQSAMMNQPATSNEVREDDE